MHFMQPKYVLGMSSSRIQKNGERASTYIGIPNPGSYPMTHIMGRERVPFRSIIGFRDPEGL